MWFRKRVAQIDLVALLLFLVLVEVVLRLAVPVLRPIPRGPLPTWYRGLTQVSLFMLHLTSALSLAVVAAYAWQLAIRRDLFATGARLVVAVEAAVFVGLAAFAVFSTPKPGLTFHLETAFVALSVTLALGLLLRPGDPLVKLGLLVLCAPLLVHYYGTFKLNVVVAEDAARWSAIPDRIRELGQWSIAMAALAAPICFAPRPLRRSLPRPGPLVVAVFVGTVGAVIMRKHYEVGMEIASRALGVELGPGAPVGTIALYITAVSLVVWTVASTLIADAPARRLIGMGFALVVAGGYSFERPVQFLCVAAGALAIARGGSRVGEQERVTEETAPRFSAPPIPDEIWQAYVRRLALAVTADPRMLREGDVEETFLSGQRGTLPFTVRILRNGQGIRSLEAIFGEAVADGAAPSWTMFARPEGLLATGVHPAPPPAHGHAPRTGDYAFDRRFRLDDAATLTPHLLDDGLRARAAAVLDGWLAVWPGRCLHYKVCPGRGAPLDHPIPVTELAFRGGASSMASERLVGVLDLLAEIARRALTPAKLA